MHSGAPDYSDCADYVLPMRWANADRLPELADYVRRLSEIVRVIVVDGSAPAVFRAHHESLSPYALHVPPDTAHAALNGKVAGVRTGLDLARAETVIVADDDVRYTEESLRLAIAGLTGCDLLVPQNVFSPMPWHAKWDSARSLMNRALGGDYPGTLVVRRSVFREMGGYSGDVLFENLELIRTVAAHGGRVRRDPGLFVHRLPPTPAHFRSQRIRQAYDSWAQPARQVIELCVLPVAVATAARGGRWRWLAPLAPIALAALGRRGAEQYFPVSTVAFAPLWTAERGVCAWLAAIARFRAGGIGYADHRIAVAAHSMRYLRAQSHRRRLVDQ